MIDAHRLAEGDRRRNRIFGGSPAERHRLQERPCYVFTTPNSRRTLEGMKSDCSRSLT